MVCHRDIKPENLLVIDRLSTKSLKLADFGLAVTVREPLFTVCGTPTYVAPEILAETGYGVKVWAWGMFFYLFVHCSGCESVGPVSFLRLGSGFFCSVAFPKLCVFCYCQN
jgi:serine/threonine protein kinase